MNNQVFSMSYDKFEEEAITIIDQNTELLKGYSDWLRISGLKDSTIDRHVSNVNFYINEYLISDDLTPAKEGMVCLGGFFNCFFPRKVMWSSVSSVKSSVASFKKFYLYLAESGSVDTLEYGHMLNAIKAEMPHWLSHYSNEELW